MSWEEIVGLSRSQIDVNPWHVWNKYCSAHIPSTIEQCVVIVTELKKFDIALAKPKLAWLVAILSGDTALFDAALAAYISRPNMGDLTTKHVALANKFGRVDIALRIIQAFEVYDSSFAFKITQWPLPGGIASVTNADDWNQVARLALVPQSKVPVSLLAWAYYLLTEEPDESLKAKVSAVTGDRLDRKSDALIRMATMDALALSVVTERQPSKAELLIAASKSSGAIINTGSGETEVNDDLADMIWGSMIEDKFGQ